MKDVAHAHAQSAAADACAWFFNVSTSVLIVFVNKVLMDSKTGYKFTFGGLLGLAGAPEPVHVAPLDWCPVGQLLQPVDRCAVLLRAATTLCAFHFLSAAAFVTVTQLLGLASKAAVPWKGKPGRGWQCCRQPPLLGSPLPAP